jgi:hypothetical protein
MPYKTSEKAREYTRKWNAANPEKVKEYNKKWKAANSEKVKEYNKKWSAANPEKVREIKRKWAAANPEKIKEADRKYRKANPEKRRENGRKWYAANPEKQREANRKWSAANPEKVREFSKKWSAANPEKVREISRKYEKHKRATDPNFRLIRNMRTALSNTLQGRNKSTSTMKIIGCTVEELFEHFESCSTWEPWMTRESYGKGGWDVDHIIPIAKWDQTCPLQFIACWDKSNLQPLEHMANIKKGAK